MQSRFHDLKGALASDGWQAQVFSHAEGVQPNTSADPGACRSMGILSCVGTSNTGFFVIANMVKQSRCHPQLMDKS
jgi:hypothetical protein